jgi:hypothetical protein
MLIFRTLPKVCYAAGMTSFLFERKVRISAHNPGRRYWSVRRNDFDATERASSTAGGARHNSRLKSL